MLVIANAFSINMLSSDCGEARDLSFKRISTSEAISLAGGEFKSIVGHGDTAAVFTSILGVEITPNRESFVFHKEDTLLVGQLTGPRLPEGAKELPPGAEIVFWLVS